MLPPFVRRLKFKIANLGNQELQILGIYYCIFKEFTIANLKNSDLIRFSWASPFDEMEGSFIKRD